MRSVIVAIMLVISLGACSRAKTVVSANPQAQQDTAAAQKIVQGCLDKGTVLTRSGRTAVLACIAPPGHKVAFEACAQKGVGADGFLTKADRVKLEADLATCVQVNR